MTDPSRHRGRRGFTVVECVVAIGVLATATVLVAQIAVQSLVERTRVDERLAAIEAAANELEAARALAWADLTSEWAAGRRPSADLSARLHEAALTVRVEAEKDRPRVKRVTVELRWSPGYGEDQRTVTTVGLFADRAAGSAS